MSEWCNTCIYPITSTSKSIKPEAVLYVIASAFKAWLEFTWHQMLCLLCVQVLNSLHCIHQCTHWPNIWVKQTCKAIYTFGHALTLPKYMYRNSHWQTEVLMTLTLIITLTGTWSIISVGSSAPVVIRCLKLGNGTFLEVAIMVVTWWIVAVLRSVTLFGFHCNSPLYPCHCTVWNTLCMLSICSSGDAMKAFICGTRRYSSFESYCM